MTRNEQKLKFLRMLIDLLMYAVSEDVPLQGGEWHRSAEEAERLSLAGVGIINSKHRKSLAVDLWILEPKGNACFGPNDPLTGYLWEQALALYNKLGAKWQALGGKWGGTFTRYNDIFHFELDETPL